MSVRNEPSACALRDDVGDPVVGLADLREVRRAERVRGPRDLDDDHLHQLRVVAVGVDDEAGDRVQLVARRATAVVDVARSPRAGRPSARGRACRAPPPWSGSSGTRGRRRRPPRRRCPTRGRCGSPGGRTRARPRRGSGGACRRRPRRAWPSGVHRPVDRRPAVGQRRQRRAGSRPGASRSRSAVMKRLAVGGLRQDDAPRVDDHRAPAGPQSRRVLADLVGGDDEALVLDRARAQQDLPVVARRRQR